VRCTARSATENKTKTAKIDAHDERTGMDGVRFGESAITPRNSRGRDAVEAVYEGVSKRSRKGKGSWAENTTIEDEQVRTMLYDKRIGKWLAVLRVQSAPVTILPMLIGYFLEATTYSEEEIGALVLAGLFAHLGMYGHNEYRDYEWDRQNRPVGKPLVEDEMNRLAVRDVSILLVTVSVTIMIIGLPWLAVSAFSLGVFCGFAYNLYSKKEPSSPMFFGIWGVCAVFTGAFHVNDGDPLVAVYALAFGLFCFLLIIVGDIKDMNNDEASFPKYLGSYIDRHDGNQLVYVTSQTRYIMNFTVIAEVLLIFFFVMLAVDRSIQYVGVGVLGLAILFFARKLGESGFKSDEKLKREIAGFTLSQGIFFIISASVFIKPIIALALIAGSCGWVFGWLYIIYSDPLYFP
jgi:4-hydroxybenzoate polyprenyltransferase